MSDLDKPEEVALAKAKIQLMRRPNTVFYTTILFSLVPCWDKQILTASTDGRHITFNPDSFLALDEDERISRMCHECLHVALDHFSRCGDRNHRVWNEAADQVINLSLIDAGYKPIKTWLRDSRFRGMSTEQVYDILMDEYEDPENDAQLPEGEDVIYPITSEDVRVVQRQVGDIVIKAAMAAEANDGIPGSIPGEMAIHLEQVTNPKLPWEVLLHNYMSQFNKGDYTWTRPNRRRYPEFYLPSLRSPALADIATGVDESGSVMDYEFNHFITEHAVIQHTLRPDKMTVIGFDTSINTIQEVRPYTDVWEDLEFHGRGGTDVHELFAWAEENTPTVLIVFTDGYFRFPDEEYWPSCPVLWIIHDNEGFDPLYGDVVHYDIPYEEN